MEKDLDRLGTVVEGVGKGSEVLLSDVLRLHRRGNSDCSAGLQDPG